MFAVRKRILLLTSQVRVGPHAWYLRFWVGALLSTNLVYVRKICDQQDHTRMYCIDSDFTLLFVKPMLIKQKITRYGGGSGALSDAAGWTRKKEAKYNSKQNLVHTHYEGLLFERDSLTNVCATVALRPLLA